VLLPVRNGEDTLQAALDSISGQTFSDFELLVVDDGSTDRTRDILQEAAGKDDRIRTLRQEPSGIVAALERARASARGAYLARMDADDLSLPRRFQLQMDLLSKDRLVVACGAGVRYVPWEAVKEGALRYERWINGLVSHEAMERDLFVECPLPHPTFLLRSDAVELVGGYRNRGWAEDYDLVLRLWEAGGRFGKVPGIHLHWREGPARLSRTHAAYSDESFRRCKVFHLLRTHLAGGRKVVVWGSGPVGKAFARELVNQGGRLAAFVDLDPRKVGQDIHGVPVLLPEVAQSFGEEFHVAAVAKGKARQEIREALAGAGRLEVRDFVAVA
jgi:cellulose synthase/poly-beta-1,6-N-acetylglucosamine synthase-like glycosyltransferase